MNMHVREPWEPHNEHMAEAVDKLGFLAHVLANYFELCPHCLVVALYEEVMAGEDEDAGE